MKRTKEEIAAKVKEVMEDYLREPSDRTLGYLQLLLNRYDTYQEAIDFMDKPINSLPITLMGQGRTDALEWIRKKEWSKHRGVSKNENGE